MFLDVTTSDMSSSGEVYSPVAEFYNGKNIFMTGAAGFVGSVLLEILLRCLPGISAIYILLRPKKELDPEARRKLIFQKYIFNTLLEKDPHIVDKVHVIAGDVSEPNLGINDEQLAELSQKVSIVFHAAAVINFAKPLRYTITQNCLGTKHVIEFCKQLPTLEAFVYTSTAYSNCNRKPRIEEVVYRLPHRAEKFLEALKNDSDEELTRLAALCKPDWPNVYTFSKCLAENVVNDLAEGMPVAILRPSIVCCPCKGPYKGYIEEGVGIVELSVAVGKGFAQTILADPEARFDLVPVDIVANAHVVAAWCIATKRLPTPLIVNNTGHNFPVLFKEFVMTLKDLAQKNPVPKSFREVNLVVTKNKMLCRILSFYNHYLPAFFVDKILAFKGKKLRLLPLYKFFEKVMQQLSFFMSTSFEFDGENFFALEAQLNLTDKEIFYMDMKDVNLVEISSHIPYACNFYDWNQDKKLPAQRRQIVVMRTMFLNLLKRTFLLLLCIVLYFVLKQIFTVVFT